MAPKKKVLAVVKIQLEAGSATPAPPSARRWDHTACRPWKSASSTTRPRRHAGSGDPGRHHDLRGPLVHVRAGDLPDARPAPPGGRARQGAATPARAGGTITDAQLGEIATTKLADLNTKDLDAAKKQVAGTARSMGIKVAG